MEDYVPLSYTLLMGYCNELMHEMDCNLIEAITAFMDDYEDVYDVYDIIEVLTQTDTLVIMDYFKSKYNIPNDKSTEDIIF